MKPPLLIAAIGVAITGFIGYNFIHAPKRGQVQLIETQLTQERANQQAQTDVAALLKEVEQYRKRLAPVPDPSWLVHEVLELGQQAGIQLTSITQQAPQDLQQQFTRLGVQLQFTASYHQLGAFLDRIENAEHFFRPEQLSIGQPAAGSDQATISLVLTTLYLPPVLQGAGG